MKAQGALLLGSAASNNQKVQIASFESFVIPLLLKHIDNEFTYYVSTYIQMLSIKKLFILFILINFDQLI